MTDVLSSYESLACKAHRYLILYKSVKFSGLRSENSLFVEHSPTLSAVWRSLWSFKWPLKVMQLHNLTFFWDCLRVISDSVAVLSLWFGVKVFFLLTINDLLASWAEYSPFISSLHCTMFKKSRTFSWTVFKKPIYCLSFLSVRSRPGGVIHFHW